LYRQSLYFPFFAKVFDTGCGVKAVSIDKVSDIDTVAAKAEKNRFFEKLVAIENLVSGDLGFAA
jgi:hypothetical protein